MRRWSRHRITCSSVLASLFVVMLLAACGPLPKPFGRTVAQPPNPLAENIFRDGVEVSPVTGTTKPMGRLLSDAVVQRLEKTYEIPAAIEGLNRSRFILTGHVHQTSSDAVTETLYRIRWRLDERDVGPISDFIQDVAVTQIEWDYGSPMIFEQVGENVGTQVAKLVLGDRYIAGGAKSIAGRAGVFLENVEGAPGDGNAALRRAMAVALGGGGVKLTNQRDEAAFVLQGRVKMGVPENAVQAIEIVWTVRDATDQVLGTAEQANAVPAGSLDGRWGQTAAFVAAAAMDGIVGIIEPNDPTRLRAPDLGSGPSQRLQPPPATLRQIPGRAPPPPG